MIRFIFVFILLLALVPIGAITFFTFREGEVPVTAIPEGMVLPQYTLVEVDMVHAFGHTTGIPYTTGAVIDVDNDGVEELFLGGGVRQPDRILVFQGDHFVNVEDQVGLVKQGDGATLGSAVLDFDGNGFQDLIVSRERGVWLYLNQDGQFTLQRLNVDIPMDGAPLAPALVDLNDDGFCDFFLPIVPRVSFLDWLLDRESDEIFHSRLYLNNGDNSFSDVTDSVGIEKIHGALQGYFTDVDADRLTDLVVLQTNGQISTWKNRDNLLFEEKQGVHSARVGRYMGMAAGDIEGDGQTDLFLSNSGSTYPGPLLSKLFSQLQGKHVDWALLTSGGDFTFRDRGGELGLSGYQMARGSLITDLNGDGLEDLVIAQNHPYWPPYVINELRLSGQVLLQDKGGGFVNVTAALGINNRNNGVTPLVAEVNNDGVPDLIFINLRGKSQIYISKGGSNNYLRVKLPDVSDSLGATVTVKLLSGEKRKQKFTVGKQLCSDSSHTLYFGLAQGKVTDVVVDYRDGSGEHTSGVLYNQTVEFD